MSGVAFDIDADAIRALARLLDETGLTEIELAADGRKLRVARGTEAPPAAVPPPAPATVPATGDETGATAGHPGAVLSPMVGTACRSPETGAAPFVEAGDRVVEGDTLLIVEAMKVMNPIRAPKGGVVARVLVEDGDPVEYGQVLAVID